jgi:hypothetical protein
VVGRDGLGPLLGRLGTAVPELRVHLIGHGLGARLVSFVLAGLPDPAVSPAASPYLRQGAFSHFAFADRLPYEPGRGGALRGMARRVDGPLVASLFVHDLAVGRLYPLASLSSREDAAAIANPLYRWGGTATTAPRQSTPPRRSLARSARPTRSSRAVHQSQRQHDR